VYIELEIDEEEKFMKGNISDYISRIDEQTSSFGKYNRQYYTEYNVKKGLRNADGTGVLAGLTAVGEVHGYVLDEGNKAPIEGVLNYRGISVEDLVENCKKENRFGYEEAIFLLILGYLPTKEELENFKEFLGSLRELPENFTEDMILKAPSKNIMNKIGRSTLSMYSYDENPDSLDIENQLRQSFKLIACIPTMIAHAYATKRHYYDKKSLVLHLPNPKYSTAENFLRMIRPNKSFTELEARILDIAMILHAEHGGGNNSTFTVRVLSSSNTDTYSAISAAIGSLKGPKHGGANEKTIRMMDEIKANVKEWTDETEVLEYLKKIIRKEAGDGSGLIYGIGHAVYTLSDPRAKVLKGCAEELAKEKDCMKEYELYNLIAKLAPTAFKEEKGIETPMPINVDFYSGFIYQMLGIPEDLFTPIFAMSRVAGWCAHRIEELLTGGKIIRPAYKTVAKRKSYIPIDER